MVLVILHLKLSRDFQAAKDVLLGTQNREDQSDIHYNLHSRTRMHRCGPRMQQVSVWVFYSRHRPILYSLDTSIAS